MPRCERRSRPDRSPRRWRRASGSRSSSPTSPGRCRASGCCPWILGELRPRPAGAVTIVIGTGSHRATTAVRDRRDGGRRRRRRGCRIVDHSAFDDDPAWRRPASASTASRCCMNRDYVEADRRIVLGFVEPHFMAGFSGGYKAVFPASPTSARSCATTTRGRSAIRADTWGVLEGNPTQTRIRHDGALCAGRLLHQRHAQPRARDHRRSIAARCSRRTRPAARSRARRRWCRASGRSRSW